MNRTSSGSMRLEKAIQGFIQSKQAEGCSDNTIITYTQQLGVWREHAGDVDVNAVPSQDVRAFLAWLRTGYEPRRINGPQKPISPKTVHNYCPTLRAEQTIRHRGEQTGDDCNVETKDIKPNRM